jgi:hypothetical protein
MAEAAPILQNEQYIPITEYQHTIDAISVIELPEEEV